jgi:glycolate oxidase FAD binding subunit
MQLKSNIDVLIDQVRAAAADGTPLCIQGGGSKDFLGGPPVGEPISTRTLTGIVSYEPSELYITARAGTPLEAIEAALAQRGQHLAFEPPRFGPGSTIGGVVAAGLSGPSRASGAASGGALRDHVLGATLLNGRGELLRFGGSVMKNVAGFDVSRLLAGSMGTLGIVVDVTLKVMPVAADTLTLRFECGEVDALESLARSASKPWPIDASAWWDGMLLLRLRGARAEVQAAARKLGGDVIPLPASDQFWAGLRDQQDEFFTKARAAVAAGNGRVGLWRLSVPATAPALGVPGEQLVEWGGALRWVCTALKPEQLRERVASVGGHATLFVGHPSTRATALAYGALPAPLDRIHRDLKRAFDPAGIFNRGRLFDDRLGSDRASGH